MLPMRRLLYHRGIDDHVGTYVTDYVYSAVCFLLCVQLFVRIRHERRKMTQEQNMTSSCCDCSNWLPWNWPKEKQSSVTLTTYAIFFLGFSNCIMSLLGGLTHQFLQTVEPYNGDVTELWEWLIVWRAGASFSAFLCLSLLIITEQLIIQEGIFRIKRKIRIGYYVISLIATICLFCYNYIPLAGNHSDPFSIGRTFILSFAVMIIYGITTIIVMIRHMCCQTSYSSESTSQYSPACSIASRNFDSNPHRKEIYSCYKIVAGGCHAIKDVTSRRLELVLTVVAPWMFVLAGAVNYFLKKKCADSDAAFVELGCPLPDSFNHNAVMHVIQIASLIIFFIAENLSMTQRRDATAVSCIRRANTSSTIYNDVINSCIITNPDSSKTNNERVMNNNKPDKRDDMICRVSMTESNESEKALTLQTDDVENLQQQPKFPTHLNYGDNRKSVYDNL